jgi:hypothetical protein
MGIKFFEQSERSNLKSEEICSKELWCIAKKKGSNRNCQKLDTLQRFRKLVDLYVN